MLNRVAPVFGWPLLFLLTLIPSAVLHLQTDLGKHVVIDALTGWINGQIQGSLEVRQVNQLALDQIVLYRVIVRDPDNREVIRATEVRLEPDWDSIRRGVIRFDQGAIQTGQVTLYVTGADDNQVSLVQTFLPRVRRPPNPNANRPNLRFENIRVRNLAVRGDVPGYSGLRFRNTSLDADIEAYHSLIFRIREGHTVMVGPYPGETQIEGIEGSFDVNPEEGLHFRATARRGGDTVPAEIRLVRPEDSEQLHLSLRAEARPVSATTLASMEIPLTDLLAGRFRGQARIEGPVRDLRLSGQLDSAAGHLMIEGHMPREGPHRYGVRARELALATLIPLAPDTEFSGEAEVTIERNNDRRTERATINTLRLRAEPLTIATLALPAFELEGRLQETRLDIDDLRARDPRITMHANGWVGYNGSMELRTRLQIPELSREPNIRAANLGLHGRFALEAELSTRPRFRDPAIDGSISWDNARLSTLRADRITLSAHMSGDLPAPVVWSQAEAINLQASQLSLGNVALSVGGGAGGYDIQLNTYATGASTVGLQVQSVAHAFDDHIAVDRTQILVRFDDSSWDGSIASARLQYGESAALESLTLAHEDERLVASLRYAFNGNVALNMELNRLNMAHLSLLQVSGQRPMSGRLDGSLMLNGPLRGHPEINLRAHVERFRIASDRAVNAELQLVQSRTGQLTPELNIDIQGGGQLAMRGTLRPPTGILLNPQALADTDLGGLELSSDYLDVTNLLRMISGTEIPLRGRWTSRLRLRGIARHPEIEEGLIIADNVRWNRSDRIRLKAHFAYAPGSLRLQRFWTGDHEGTLASAEAEIPFNLMNIPRNARSFFQSLYHERFWATAQIHARRPAEWPSPLRDYFPRGLRSSAILQIDGNDRGVEGDLWLNGTWVEAATNHACAENLRPSFRMHGRFAGDQTTAELEGFFRSAERQLHGTASASTPIDAWLARGGFDRFPPIEANLRVEGANLADIPWACDYGAGQVHAGLNAAELFTEAPQIRLDGAINGLQLRTSDENERAHLLAGHSYRVSLDAQTDTDDETARFCMIVGDSTNPPLDEGVSCDSVTTPRERDAIIQASIPTRWQSGSLLPAIDGEQGLLINAALERVELAPILRLVPGLSNATGTGQGALRARGNINALMLEGQMRIEEGHFQLDSLGQQLNQVEGTVRFQEGDAIIPQDEPLIAHDGTADVRASGRIGFEGLLPRNFQLALNASDFPIRQEGNILARLTGDAEMQGRITNQETTSQITTGTLNIDIPPASNVSVQPLEAHPDIIVVGEESVLENEQGIQNNYEFRINLDGDRGFWVNRNDFSTRVQTNLDARYTSSGLSITGTITLQRGTFDLYGRRFEIQPSTLRFDPSSGLDPRVDITAEYPIPGEQNNAVTVRLTGPLSNPDVDLSAPGRTDRSEIVALLISGPHQSTGVAENELVSDAVDTISNALSGVLTLFLREQIQANAPSIFTPILSIQGYNATANRLFAVRAGINVDSWIPEAIRDVVVGAYIEGFFNVADQGGGTGGGFTVELNFPYNFYFQGTYLPANQNGSFDLLYEP